jgi:uncharacterized phage protein gp47/JayE
LPEFSEFLPLLVETTDSIRERVYADATAGLAVTDPAYPDLVEGSVAADLFSTMILEAERLWDFVSSELPASMFPAFTFADYLDEWGVTLSLPRKDAVLASGVVRFTGTSGALIGSNVKVSTQQTDPDVDPVEFQTTESGTIPVGGFIDLAVEALVAGVAGNAGAGTIVLLNSPVANIASVTNAAAMTGGTEVENDDAYRERILLEFSSPQGAGNQADYARWALAYPGVGHVTVEAIWAGPGTVRVIVTDQFNAPVAGAVVTGLQAELDPSAGLGAGLAPVGATVTVVTPAQTTVNVSATVSFKTGFTLDGTAGTIALRTAIVAAIQDYLASLSPGDDVILNHVLARFFVVDGVLNVATVLLNGAAVDVVLDSLHVGKLGTVTLT